MTNPLIARFAGEPTLVAEQSAERFKSCLAQAAEHPHFAEMMAERADTTDDFWGAPEGSWRASLRPYVVKDGVLQIPVKGVLLHDFPFAFGDWATGYDYIWRAFQRGCGDFATGAIKGIALVCDTPGGMVAGCFDAVDKMVALKDSIGVPVRAFAHESAYSAGYAIATVADHIAVSRTGGVGSIGVVTSHIDWSGAMAQDGIKVTFIASDPSKVEGNPYEPLSADAKARIQARIDELYSIFVAAVVRSRDLSEETVRTELKAHTFTATQAMSNGLADSVGSLEDATSAFAEFLDAPSDNQGEPEMTTPVETVDKAVHDAAVAEARAAGVTEGAAAMQTRIGAILGSEDAKGRETLAQHFAFKSDMPADAALAALAAAPKAEAPAPAPAPAPAAAAKPQTFAEAMETENPDVGAQGGNGNGGGNAEQSADDLKALAASVGLCGYAKK